MAKRNNVRMLENNKLIDLSKENFASATIMQNVRPYGVSWNCNQVLNPMV